MEQTRTVHDSEAFADNVLRVVRSVVLSQYPKLLEVWKELWDFDEQEKRKEILETHLTETVSNVMEEIIIKEFQTKEEYIVRIEKLLDDISKFESKLDVDIPFGDVQSLPLHPMAMQLNKKTAKYRSIIEERINRYNHLCSQESVLCEVMGLTPLASDADEFPSEAQLEHLLHHVQELDSEKTRRMIRLVDTRLRIIELHQLLGVSAVLLFEKNVVEEDPSEFRLTDDNMRQLQDIVERLEEELKCATERRDNLLKMIQSMWDYLEEPNENQEQFLKDHSGVTTHDLDALRAELDRCKKEKSANIEKFVNRIRQDILAQWNKCLVSDDTRKEFRVFHMNYFNEDVYDLHEIELSRWQQYYSANSNIFELYHQHSALFEKLLELHGRGKSADRYHNRGGQLLQEERQRKQVAKELPKVEDRLRNAASAYQIDKGEPFTVLGKPLVDLIDEKWAANFDKKTIDKFRNVPPSSVGRTPMAMKRPAQPAASTGAKLLRSATQTNINTKGRRRLYTANPETVPDNNATLQLEPSYADFQKTFSSKLGSNKMVSRSTELLSPGRVLRERNVLTPARSTPALCPPVTPLSKPAGRRQNTPKPAPRTPASRTRLPVII